MLVLLEGELPVTVTVSPSWTRKVRNSRRTTVVLLLAGPTTGKSSSQAKTLRSISPSIHEVVLPPAQPQTNDIKLRVGK